MEVSVFVRVTMTLSPPGWLYRPTGPLDDEVTDGALLLGDWPQGLLDEPGRRTGRTDLVQDRHERLQRLTVAVQRPLHLPAWPRSPGAGDAKPEGASFQPLDGTTVRVLRDQGYDAVAVPVPGVGRVWQVLAPARVTLEASWLWSDVAWRCDQLVQAVLESDLAELEVALAGGASVEPHRGAHGTLHHPLLLAIDGGEIRMVERLIGTMVDVNRPDGDGDAPLLRAARQGREPMVQALLDAGADVGYRHPVSGQNAVDEARQRWGASMLLAVLERQALTEFAQTLSPASTQAAARRPEASSVRRRL